MSVVEVGDLTFDVDVLGPQDGTPVVLLHGWPQDRRSWREVADRLAAQGLRVIVPDQRGYSPGARPEGVESYGSDLLAQDVVDIAAALGHDRFHLVGHDWGAAVSWVVATGHADRVLSLTAVSVPHLAAYNEALSTDPDQQQRAAYIGLLRRPGKAEQILLEDDGARLRAMYGGAVAPDDEAAYADRFSQPGALTATLNWYRAMGPELSATPAVTVPTTFVWGASDQALGRYGAERCGDHVTADYRFVEVDGGHWLPDTHPDLVATEVLARVLGR
ncbi:alpha/beta fold hydrolase [Aeromicrobium sp. 636]|uniref:Alpha/beta hydrolase n=1 Tax=Aeromicrobium senzhongii TaxID=2663859 RepID=A0A8I0K308_9ACTN|nr:MULTISPECIES: alpha/beta hydrolase [Aeromicrobium]MBC9227259.1 alpha/beta hydrolase [Aeromicrobium senzhongii]MCQ3999357.1 alpha/beta fold hydrolase [Aeromicrobium sp. 636]